ncbi:glycosyl hydrolase family 28-related protein [Polystyrenella longa]|nr:glycosyl hydrolase family 28-related protein [Polystyrenella longa]
MLTPQLSLSGAGVVVMQGTDQNDVAVISEIGNGRIRASISTGNVEVSRDFNLNGIKSIYFQGENGDDSFRNDTDLPSTAYGGFGDDLLYGGGLADFLYGDQGNDRLLGRGGNDVLHGGSGHDVLRGHNGNDHLIGADGSDQLYGGDGRDILDGNDGSDYLNGENGYDELHGGSGNDRLVDEFDGDWLDVGSGIDKIIKLIPDVINSTPDIQFQNPIATLVEDVDTSNGIVIAEIVIFDDGIGENNLRIVGDDAGLFSINNNHLMLRPGAVLNAQNNGVLDVTVEVDDPALGAGVEDRAMLSVEILRTNSSVQQFGAVGDGVTDDTAALQAAFDAAEGRELFINAGTYLISEPLLIPSNTKIYGAGNNSILQFTWHDQSEGREFHLGNRDRSDETTGDSNIELRDFALYGGFTGDPYGVAYHDVTHGIFFRRVENVLVTGVTIGKTSGFGIANNGLINGTFTNNTIENVGRDGITSFPLVFENDSSYPTYPLQGLVISNNRLSNLGDDAIAVHAGTQYGVNFNYAPHDITIENNTIIGRVTEHQDAQGRGIVLTGVRDATISGNNIRNTVSTGILIQASYNWGVDSSVEAIRSRDVLVTNNTLLGIGSAQGLDRVKIGIQVKGADRVTLISNTVRDTADRGIDVRNATQIKVDSSDVSGSQGKSGIVVSGGNEYDVRNATITDNEVQHWNDKGLFLYNVVNSFVDGNSVN